MDNVINTFRIKDGIWIDHIINSDNNDAKFEEVSSKEILMTVKSDYQAYIKDVKDPIGFFNIDDNDLWSFKFVNASKELITGNKSLIKAEMKVFKKLVELDWI